MLDEINEHVQTIKKLSEYLSALGKYASALNENVECTSCNGYTKGCEHYGGGDESFECLHYTILEEELSKTDPKTMGELKRQLKKGVDVLNNLEIMLDKIREEENDERKSSHIEDSYFYALRSA